MKSFFYCLEEIVRGRWASRVGACACRASVGKVALAFGGLIFEFPMMIPEAVLRLWISGGRDHLAWNVMFCCFLAVFTACIFLWLAQGFEQNYKDACWLTPSVRIR